MSSGRKSSQIHSGRGSVRARRHPDRGGYERGERTRRRILESAIELFGDHGLEGTSTRAISRRAGVSLPALQYYFGGKDGLHRACFEYITADLQARLSPALTRTESALRERRLADVALLELLRTLIEPLLEGMATDRPSSWLLFFTREQAHPSAAFELFFERVGTRLLGLCMAIIGRLARRPAHDPQIRIRALAIVSQVVAVRRMRPLLLRALGWPDFNGKRLTLLKRVLWQTIAAGLIEIRPARSRRAADRRRSPAASD
ncbi:MAG TPA: CerR family C-terminal domain-containing protein [Steroidobacteraceae bacterium]|nr:CerR family C-terminal domain-containing protein [Steroidobacteraceae bacterium]